MSLSTPPKAPADVPNAPSFPQRLWSFFFWRPQMTDRVLFNPRLESLCGIAALIVAIYHAFMVFFIDDIHHPMRWSSLDLQAAGAHILCLVFNSSAAVLVFFVLSGYVLSLSLDRVSYRVSVRLCLGLLLCSLMGLMLGSSYMPESGNIFIIMTGFCAAILVALMVYGPDFRFYRHLDNTVAPFYGPISYSFYLLQIVMLYILLQLTLTFLPGSLITAYPLALSLGLGLLHIPFTTGFSALVFEYIEKPWIETGRRITQSRFLTGRSPE